MTFDLLISLFWAFLCELSRWLLRGNLRRSAAGSCGDVLKVPLDVPNEQLGAGNAPSVPEISAIVARDMNRSLPSSVLQLNFWSGNTFSHRMEANNVQGPAVILKSLDWKTPKLFCSKLEASFI